MYPSVCCEACAGSARLIGCPESLLRKIRDSENQRTLLYVPLHVFSVSIYDICVNTISTT